MKYKDVVNIAAEPVKDNKGPIILGLLALLGVMAVIFISNLLGWFWPMVVLMLASLVLVTMVGFKAEILVNFAFFGAFIHLLQDKDKSQGAAQGLKWLTEIVIAVGFGFYFFTFTLLTWDFSNYPGAYWVFFFGIVLLKLVDAHYKIPTSWAPKAIKAYIGICIVVVGVRTITGVYPDVNFTNGEAVTMVHSVTRDPVKGYSPEMCRSEYIEGVLIEYPAKGFDYATMSTCRDPHDNARIVPITTEDVQRQNAKTWGSTVNGAVSKHPAISWVEERIHMPWWVAGLIVVGTIVVWRIIPRKKKSGSDSKEESKDYGINLAAVIVALGFSSLLAAVAVIALNVAGVMNGLSFSTAVAMADSCATPASVEHYKFDER
ncbi:MAG: hypothetical protein KC877_05120, partial [Candidatus Kaiserbacteria bacterium]|nr:hypothetical protein [Candidatus Kaiserbacteria bacterium]